VLEAYLGKGGYKAERAYDGREAVAAAHRCDLILMDLEMPEMDGLEATRRIRAQEREAGLRPVPILSLTAHALQEYRERCLAAGCSGYLSKPIRMQSLLDAVAAALGESREAAPTPSDPVGGPLP
jgi:CheY-like chemotaxis protein